MRLLTHFLALPFLICVQANISAHELRHLCYFEPKGLPPHVGKVAILDPNALHLNNLDRALTKKLSTKPDHLQVDVEVKGLPFKERFPGYVHADAGGNLVDARSLKTLELIRQLECESVDLLQRRLPQYPIHFWVSGNHQANRDAVRKIDDPQSPDKKLAGLLRLGAIADVECFYSSKQSIKTWEAKQIAPGSRARQFRKFWPGPACLCVNINDHFKDREPFGPEVLAAMVRIAEELGFEYIGWCVFNNDKMAYGSYQSTPELINWKSITKPLDNLRTTAE
jgi:hypothetical protein